jgi:hypothetical protein
MYAICALKPLSIDAVSPWQLRHRFLTARRPDGSVFLRPVIPGNSDLGVSVYALIAVRFY